MCVCGLNGLMAVELPEDVDARLIVVVACRRGQGLVSVLDERGPVDLMIIMAGTNDLAMNGSWHGASQDPGPARGVSNGTVALREPQSFFTFEKIGGTTGGDVDVRGDAREGHLADGPFCPSPPSKKGHSNEEATELVRARSAEAAQTTCHACSCVLQGVQCGNADAMP